MECFYTRLALSKYFSPVNVDDTYNIAKHYFVQTGYENLSVPRRQNSESPLFPGPCEFVRHLEEVDHHMLRQAAKRSCAALADIRFIGTDDDNAIYNAILSECNSMTFHILGLEHTKKNISDKLKDLNFPNCQTKKNNEWHFYWSLQLLRCQHLRKQTDRIKREMAWNRSYNPVHNILALFNNLAQVRIAICKTILDIYLA